MRVAAIDIGTNSVLLLVADGGMGGAVAVEERATITRLGQGVDRTRVLAPAAIERTEACLAEYADRVRVLGVDSAAIVGTSALRDATGADRISAFVAARFGVPLRIISGREEALLAFRGALSGLPADSRVDAVVFDVGGGSTELIRGTYDPDGSVRLDYAESFDIGSVRLTERHLASDPPTSAELRRASEHAALALAQMPLQAEARPLPVGVAGTVTTLAAVSMEMASYDGTRVHGSEMSLDEVNRVVSKLARVTVAHRRDLAGMHPGRADVIVGGGVVVLAVLEKLRASGMRVSDRGVRWGLADELLALKEHDRAPC